jgi:hypothetical protein
LVKNGYINKDDFSLFHLARSVDEAVSYIENFYRVYHSIRYVSGMTIIRLKTKISLKTLELINKEFKDILTSGEITFSPPTKEEAERREFLDLPRLAMNYNLHDYGRLLELIRIINKS